MKIEVITLHRVKNYGAVLQAVSTQKFFKDLGYDVEMIDYWRKDLVHPVLDYFQKCDIKRFIKCVLCFPGIVYIVWKKNCVFTPFVEDLLNLTEHRYIGEEDFRKYDLKADIFCSGSDQVWNCKTNRGFLAPFYLSFINNRKSMKISFASSFGSSVPDKYKDLTRHYLKKYDKITVREQVSIKYLDNIGVRNSEAILDPTLLVSSDFWYELCSKKNFRNYILVYDLSNNNEIEKLAKQLSDKYHLSIVRIGIGFSQIKYKNTKLFPSVKDWLCYFKNADFVITDSFHGVCFSLIFEKQFFVFNPPTGKSRILNLLNITKLQNCLMASAENADLENMAIDYCEVNKILDNEREKAQNIFSF